MGFDLEAIRDIAVTSPSKIVLVVVDGLGGLPHPDTGKTELETANTPNLDRLAALGTCGLSEPVHPGITPGSAPGHLALFGYDPGKYAIGRGVLEAVGIEFDLQPGDVAARGNFGTIDESGHVTDRRAGRISTETNEGLCRLLDGMTIDDVRVLVRPVREHRLIVVFRGQGLVPLVTDSDPEQTGVAPHEVTALAPEAERLASAANEFLSRARGILAGHRPTNMVLLRGFSGLPHLPSMRDIYRLRPAAIASYPMYRGLARLVGMEVLRTGATIEEEFATLRDNYLNFDFFFLHVKGADSAGEDGDFARKVSVIERMDQAMSGLISLSPEVIVVTGDHSTPALLKSHSWHPVPLLLYSRWCRPDRAAKFGETACRSGGLGHLPATQIMPLAMANALKLTKYGA